jgi:hypothetical protein
MVFVSSSRLSRCFGVTLIAGSIAAAGSIPLILAFVEPTQLVVLASLATTIVLGGILFVATSRLARTADLDQAFALLKFLSSWFLSQARSGLPARRDQRTDSLLGYS